MKNMNLSPKNPIKTHIFNKTVINVLILATFIATLISPQVGYGQVISVDGLRIDNLSANSAKIEVIRANDLSLPVISSRKPMTVVNMVVTAYTSEVSQTDDAPCITASGMDICERGAEDIVATNFNWLPFGTRIKIPELFGDRVFIVHDRMNSRYSQRVDVWMKSYADAVKFGKKYAAVEIY